MCDNATREGFSLSHKTLATYGQVVSEISKWTDCGKVIIDVSLSVVSSLSLLGRNHQEFETE